MNVSRYKPNQVILILIFALFVLTAAANLSIPFFALFVTQDIAAAASAVGIAAAIYWIVKSTVQLPVARRIDRNRGEYDDYYSLLIGIAITTTGVFLFYFANELWQVLLLQALIGVGDAFAVPPIYAIFTRHIDRGEEGYDWTLESSFSLGAGSAIGSAFAGVLVGAIGIRNLFLVNGGLMAIGFIILLFLRPYILPRVPPPPPVDRFLLERRRRG